ncbi:MAG: hypothetical protein KJO26_01205 [Deltaproteobacteria bacterium]|nr:hypothetical protein [Deltaproteobacteria bacterium]
MKEYDVALKAFVDGLRSIAQGVEKLAEKLEESVPKKQPKAKPVRKAKIKAAPKAKAVPKPKAKPVRKTTAKSQKAPAKKAVKATAADVVLSIVNRSKKGVSNATLVEKTGFDKKKVANIVFKLKKTGKIKNFIRGVYTKA